MGGSPLIHPGAPGSSPLSSPPRRHTVVPSWRRAPLGLAALTLALPLLCGFVPAAAAGEPGPVCGLCPRLRGEETVDWSGRRILLRGVSLPRRASYRTDLVEGDPRQRARLDARARLEATLGALPHHGEHGLAELAPLDPDLQAALARVVAEMQVSRVAVMPDGVGFAWAEAHWGPLLPWLAAQGSRRGEEGPADGLEAPAVADEDRGSGAGSRASVFSGVVVDARSLGAALTPALQPRVVGPSGRTLLWPQGPVTYCCSAPRAAAGLGAGAKPLRLSARRHASETSDPLVEGADAQTLSAAFPGRAAPLVIVITPQAALKLPR